MCSIDYVIFKHTYTTHICVYMGEMLHMQHTESLNLSSPPTPIPKPAPTAV